MEKGFQIIEVIDRDIRKEVKEIIAEVVNQRIHKSKDYQLLNSDTGIIAQKAGDRVLVHIYKNWERFLFKKQKKFSPS